MRFFSFLFLLFLSSVLVAQPLGTWKLYFSYKGATGLEDVEDEIWVGSTNALYNYDKSSGLITFYDKESILSDVGIKCIDYNKSTQTLAIAYTNSNIDLIINGTDIYNIPDLKNKVISGTKNINAICNAGQRIYFATDIGVLAINQSKKEIAETYVIGSTGENVRVLDVAVGNNQIFAATEQGMKSAPLNAANLQDFNNWKSYTTSDSLPQRLFIYTEFAANKFYAVCNDTLFMFNGNLWEHIFFDQDLKVRNIDSRKDDLFVMLCNEQSGEGKILQIDAFGNQHLLNAPGGQPIQYFTDDAGTVWYGDLYNGVYRDGESINPNSPSSNSTTNVTIKNNTVWVSGGGVSAAWSYTFNYSGMYVMENNQWKNFNRYTYPTLVDFPDIANIEIADDGKKAWLGSLRSGLAEIDLNTGIIQQFNKDNSPLSTAVADPSATWVTALARDKKGNLWMVNSYTNFGLIVKKPDNTWIKLPCFNSNQLAKKLLITSNGYKWMPLRPNSIAVYYEGNDLGNTADDVMRFLGSGKGNGGLNNVNVNCIVEDKSKAVWVGTDAGIEVFNCASSVLSQGGCDAQRIIVQRDGFNGYLFETEVVKALAVDAANRKWVGTNNGVWLISADGKEELLRFTVDNSPLPSNFISDIAINQKTGEVFFATEQGLASYLGDAIEGGESCNKALVYPNPIRADYDGLIAIKNLVDDAYVKITDASGLLVYQNKANGGQMIWDAKTYKGNRVASGVYTVFSANEMGKERCVAKIVIQN